MDKGEFVAELKQYKKSVDDLVRKCIRNSGPQIQKSELLSEFEVIGTLWFDSIEPRLRNTYQLDDDTIQRYREPLGKLLELAGGRPSKNVVQTILGAISQSFHRDLIVPVQQHEAILSKFPSLDTVLSHAVGLEIDYLTEAIDCARLGKRRASIILGWCATIHRLHAYVIKEGFDKFNSASVTMSAIQSGRYKRFNHKFDIQNVSDLRMTVFDNDLLWVLEFLGAIESNQHDRLGICFTMRNTSAHPGEAILSDENVLSFFSDIDTMVFNNPNFSI